MSTAPKDETAASLARLGNAASTVRVDKAAEIVFNEFQDLRGEPHLKELTLEYVEGENMKLALMKFNSYLCNTRIKKKNGSEKGFMLPL